MDVETQSIVRELIAEGAVGGIMFKADNGGKDIIFLEVEGVGGTRYRAAGSDKSEPYGNWYDLITNGIFGNCGLRFLAEQDFYVNPEEQDINHMVFVWRGY